MSTFKVTFETIATLSPIPDADKIVQAGLTSMDFSFVVKKGVFEVGSTGVYIPLDAVVPDVLLEKIGLTGKLAGSKHNRVKTVTLRGCQSQGLFIPCDIVFTPEELASADFNESKICGKDLHEHLGIVKFEPEEGTLSSNAKGLLPSFLTKYDIESTQRFRDTFNELAVGNTFLISEKLEGQNHAVCVDENDCEIVCSRSLELKDEPSSLFWRTARENDLFTFCRNVKKYLNAKVVTVYSEQCGPGIQGNNYKLLKHELFTFDIKVDGKWVVPEVFLVLTEIYNRKICPVLFIGTIENWLKESGKDSLVASSNGKSLIADTLREGVVFKPIKLKPGCDRIYKIRSPQYLGTSENV